MTYRSTFGTGKDIDAALARASTALQKEDVGISFTTVDDLQADTELTYAEGQPGFVRPDEIIFVREVGFSYRVAPANATDALLTTSGGVKLHPIPGPMGLDIRQLGAKSTNGVYDPRPAMDITAIMQAAVDSPHPVYVPAGYWYQAGTVFVYKTKTLTFAEGLTQIPWGTAGAAAGFRSEASHARIYTDQNEHFYNITASHVYFYGGTFDTSQIVFYNKAVFYYPIKSLDWPWSGRTSVWYGGCKGFHVQGNLNSFAAGWGWGVTAIMVDMLGEQNLDSVADIAYCSWEGYCVHVHRGLYVSPRPEGGRQWSNRLSLNLDVEYSQQALVMHGSNGRFNVRYGGNPTLLAEDVETKAAVELHSNENILFLDTVDMFGTRKSVTVADPYDATKTVDLFCAKDDGLIEGINNVLDTNTGRSSYKGKGGFAFNQNITGANGFIPRMNSGYEGRVKRENTLILSDLYNIFSGIRHKCSSFTVEAYSGIGVDFEALTQTSASANIPISNQIEIVRPEIILGNAHHSAGPQFDWSEEAQNDGDYVEINISDIQGTRIHSMYFSYSQWRCNFEKIQVVIVHNDGTIRENRIDETAGGATRPWAPDHLHKMLFDNSRIIGSGGRVTIRFIGLKGDPRSGITINDIFATNHRQVRNAGWFVRNYEPVDKHGTLTMHDDLVMNSSNWDGGSLLQMGNHRLWVDRSGNLRIKNGVPNSDADGTIVGLQG